MEDQNYRAEQQYLAGEHEAEIEAVRREVPTLRVLPEIWELEMEATNG